MKQMQVTNESLNHSEAEQSSIDMQLMCQKVFYIQKMVREKHWGVLRCRVRCDVFALQVKAIAAWPDRAVYHTVLWWWILDWFTWLVLASRRLKGLYYTHMHNCVRIWTGTRAKLNICLESPRITNCCYLLNKKGFFPPFFPVSSHRYSPYNESSKWPWLFRSKMARNTKNITFFHSFICL